MKLVCYLDMDEVLVDFVRGSMKAHDLDFPVKDLRWDMALQLGFGDRRGEFWSRFGREFWAELDWTHEGRAVLAGVERIFGEDNVLLMSSPVVTPGCVEGKLDWIRKHAPSYARRFAFTPAKHLAAGPGKVLIDDNDENCTRFCLAGGVYLQPPRPWNDRRDLTDDEGRFDVEGFLSEVRDVVAPYAYVGHKVEIEPPVRVGRVGFDESLEDLLPAPTGAPVAIRECPHCEDDTHAN